MICLLQGTSFCLRRLLGETSKIRTKIAYSVIFIMSLRRLRQPNIIKSLFTMSVHLISPPTQAVPVRRHIATLVGGAAHILNIISFLQF